MPGFNLHGCIDAQVWAEEFCRINPSMDEGTMLAWFANAIMAGIDSEQQKPVHTLATATNRELLQEVANRTGLWFAQEHPLTEAKNMLVATKEPWQSEANQEYYCEGKHLNIGKVLLDGPWQDSLIGPEV